MIAIAGKCYSNALVSGSALISDVFEYFTRQMLHRLDQPRDIVRAQKVIDVYFSLLLSPLTPSKNITVSEVRSEAAESGNKEQMCSFLFHKSKIPSLDISLCFCSNQEKQNRDR